MQKKTLKMLKNQKQITNEVINVLSQDKIHKILGTQKVINR